MKQRMLHVCVLLTGKLNGSTARNIRVTEDIEANRAIQNARYDL